MQRADNPDIQCCGLLQHRLHLRAVFADDSEVIPSCFTGPAFLVHGVQRAELAEGVRAEQHLVLLVVGHHDLRPVHHRRGNELQRMAAELQCVPFLCDDPPAGVIFAGKVLHHGEGLGRRHDLRFRILLRESFDAGGMVRLHVVHDQVVRLPARQRSFQVFQPGAGEVPVRGIHDRNLFIQDHIGIVGHAFRHDVHSLKQVDFVIVHADIINVLCNAAHVRFSFRNVLNCFILPYQRFMDQGFRLWFYRKSATITPVRKRTPTKPERKRKPLLCKPFS